MKQTRHILGAKHTLIERTAADLAGTWYEIGRGQGMTSKWSTPTKYAKANFEKFIPKAVELLMDMLGRPDIAEGMKEAIYDALMERANDPDLAILGPVKPLPNVNPTILHNLANPLLRTG